MPVKFSKWIIFIFVTAMAAMFFFESIKGEEIKSPCNDSVFVFLKSQPLDSLSEMDLVALIFKAKSCADFCKGIEKKGKIELQLKTKNENSNN